ncbi:MAG TPA: ribosome recycling factor [Anaerolineae bacterium]|nr:ribosome recycling factor [Anaerolineae bacterium]HOR01314.1 ribosome recycling factor [Anaerolineae bacterium]HPL30332.1 ribosome recycling factor [Anaerolineae bacterium]
MINDCLHEAEGKMGRAVAALRDDLVGIRTGRASPALLDRVRVDYYGSPTPLNQLASVAAPEPRLLVIRPWDTSAIGIIEKGILRSDLGLTPSNDGKVIRLPIPQLTEERRRELARMVSRRVEEGHVALRNIRRDSLKDMQDLEKEKLIAEDDFYRGKERLQELTDQYVKEMDELGRQKQAEIMEF